MTKKLNKKGFTLIEVVLVLAIGGLIFLLAFIAFGQASKNRRDTQRRSDAGRVISEIQNATGDGFKFDGTSATTMTTSVSSFNTTYLGALTGPKVAYTLSGVIATPGTITTDNMYVAKDFVCNGNNALTASTGNYAVIVGLEKGSACRDDK
jgi:prepilin-type N-terminal cleavage/methylation domain-containing protein